jgi:hypothetical protein
LGGDPILEDRIVIAEIAEAGKVVPPFHGVESGQEAAKSRFGNKGDEPALIAEDAGVLILKLDDDRAGPGFGELDLEEKIRDLIRGGSIP